MDKDEWIQQWQEDLAGPETLTPAERKTVEEMTAELYALQTEAKAFTTGGYIIVPLWEDGEI
jgi:hypothetical protein